MLIVNIIYINNTGNGIPVPTSEANQEIKDIGSNNEPPDTTNNG
jgi:hypothetical protein